MPSSTGVTSSSAHCYLQLLQMPLSLSRLKRCLAKCSGPPGCWVLLAADKDSVLKGNHLACPRAPHLAGEASSKWRATVSPVLHFYPVNPPHSLLQTSQLTLPEIRATWFDTWNPGVCFVTVDIKPLCQRFCGEENLGQGKNWPSLWTARTCVESV